MNLESMSLPGVFPREFSYNQPQSASFKDTLAGDKAFYNRPDYLKATQRNFAQHDLLPVNYTWNTENKIIRIAKQIFSIIISPIGIYKLLHAFAGKIALLPASNPTLMGYPENHANNSRSTISLNGEWKYKRITVEVDGYKIDATIDRKSIHIE